MKPTKEEIESLIARALAIRENAYAPYSNYRVGAALICESGAIYDGANVENASYPLTTCAERTAIAKAVSDGEREIRLLVVASENGGAPCGACRQILSEFGKDAFVIVVDMTGKIVLDSNASQLLPYAFGPDNLMSS